MIEMNPADTCYPVGQCLCFLDPLAFIVEPDTAELSYNINREKTNRYLWYRRVIRTCISE